MKVFMLDPAKCTGCNLCELTCSFNKHKIFNRNFSNIRIERNEALALNVPVKCMQCDDSPCINACVAGALYKDENTGAVLLDDNRCILCKACIIACPFGCISLITKAKIFKISLCDLCSGEPECIKVCRDKAIYYIDERKINRSKRESTFYKVLHLKSGE
ncbi:MAG: 4Fe-4S dicluster domain-containing protein [Spirochaetota bacterium]